MKGSWFGYTLAFLITTAPALAADVSRAPLRGGLPSRPAPEFVGQSAQAPAWLAWRAFHSSLEFYSLESAGVVQEMLMSRLGVGADKAELVMRLGRQYLDQIEVAERQGKEDLNRRFPLHMQLPANAQELPRMSDQEQLARRKDVEALRAKDRQMSKENGRDILTSDGTIERFETARSVDLKNHVTTLRDQLGIEAFTRLNIWIESDVMPKVRVVR